MQAVNEATRGRGRQVRQKSTPPQAAVGDICIRSGRPPHPSLRVCPSERRCKRAEKHLAAVALRTRAPATALLLFIYLFIFKGI